MGLSHHVGDDSPPPPDGRLGELWVWSSLERSSQKQNALWGLV